MYKAYGKNVCDEYPIQLDLVFFFLIHLLSLIVKLG